MSLRIRLIAVVIGISVVVTTLSITMVTRAADRALRDQNRQSLAEQAVIYRSLSDWGLGHRDWRGATGLIYGLAKRYDTRIALTDLHERVLVDSDTAHEREPRALPELPTARVDPWLPVVSTAEGLLDSPLSSPQTRLAPSVDDVLACLRARGVKAVKSADGGLIPAVKSPRTNDIVQSCYVEAMEKNSAPVALLFLGTRAEIDSPFSGPSTGRTVAIGAFIATIAMLLGWWIGRRLTRPLNEVGTTAGRLAAGHLSERADVRSRDEVGRVGLALNSLADSLQRGEAQRRQLVRDVAHELGNPVVTIGGTLEAIQDGIHPASPEVIDSLADEVNHLSTLIADLADLARFDSDGVPLDLQDCDLNRLCISVVTTTKPVAVSRGVALALDPWPAPLVLRADPARLRQVLRNLLDNALRHTPAGGAVTVSTRVGAEGVSLGVADTGTGISIDDQAHIFDRFWRGDASRSLDTGGSGLGLAIVRELVVAHGGAISVRSRSGGGTEFEVRFPPLSPA